MAFHLVEAAPHLSFVKAEPDIVDEPEPEADSTPIKLDGADDDGEDGEDKDSDAVREASCICLSVRERRKKGAAALSSLRRA